MRFIKLRATWVINIRTTLYTENHDNGLPAIVRLSQSKPDKISSIIVY
jgi:hypothetical protein